MSTVLLIRHGIHDVLGEKILGRTPGIHLNDLGRQQAEQLADTLSVLPIGAIYSGPLERTRETAEPLARRLHLPLQLADEFDELEMGDWTDRTLTELDVIPGWRNWNTRRTTTRPPNGEWMHQVQTRVLEKLAALTTQFRCMAIFTHCDVIRAALTHFLGMDLDLLFRLQIDPASTSVVQMHDAGAIVQMVNWIPMASVIPRQ